MAYPERADKSTRQRSDSAETKQDGILVFSGGTCNVMFPDFLTNTFQREEKDLQILP